jgi:hypothetical protein
VTNVYRRTCSRGETKYAEETKQRLFACRARVAREAAARACSEVIETPTRLATAQLRLASFKSSRAANVSAVPMSVLSENDFVSGSLLSGGANSLDAHLLLYLDCISNQIIIRIYPATNCTFGGKITGTDAQTV